MSASLVQHHYDLELIVGLWRLSYIPPNRYRGLWETDSRQSIKHLLTRMWFHQPGTTQDAAAWSGSVNPGASFPPPWRCCRDPAASLLVPCTCLYRFHPNPSRISGDTGRIDSCEPHLCASLRQICTKGVVLITVNFLPLCDERCVFWSGRLQRCNGFDTSWVRPPPWFPAWLPSFLLSLQLRH